MAEEIKITATLIEPPKNGTYLLVTQYVPGGSTQIKNEYWYEIEVKGDALFNSSIESLCKHTLGRVLNGEAGMAKLDVVPSKLEITCKKEDKKD